MNLQRDLQREWLLAGGHGGFAMGTRSGVNTRRYHALLVAAVAPPAERIVAVRATVEQLLVGDTSYDLWTQLFGDDAAPAPDGWTRVTAFEAHPAAGRVAWTLEAGGVQVRRTLHLATGTSAASLTWRVRPARDVVLRVRPLTPLTGFHELRREGGVPPRPEADAAGRVWVRRDGRELCLHGAGGSWHPEPDWWRRLAYPAERDRGLDWREDAWSPGRFDFAADADEATFTLRFGLGHLPPKPAPDPPADGNDPRPGSGVADLLSAAADQFIVTRPDAGTPRTSIIAGYPWFADWGRDAMIAAPGLLLARGRIDETVSLLELFAAHRREGLIPCRFDDDGTAEHHDHADGSLWFIHVLGALADAAPRRVTPALLGVGREIVHAYRAGTAFGIGMDGDGLIAAGGPRWPDRALTWMDARRDGVPVTPRDGKAVEVNALWYHALRTMAAIDPGAPEGLERLAARVAASFRDAFLLPDGTCRDRLVQRDGGWAPDDTLRPNQVFAASLPHSPLPVAARRAIVETLGARLLTPCGLRTLDPDDPGYRGRFEGPLPERDAAYHQGTAWPWLLGPYAEALLRLDDGPDTRARVADLFRPLLDTLEEGCFGQIAEVYDGDAPQRPDGCPAQAWSVAETLRLSVFVP